MAERTDVVSEFFAVWQKLVMIVLMWLGRLEFFAVVALTLPRFWRV